MGGLISPEGALCLSCGKRRGLVSGLPLCPACAGELVRAERQRGTLCPRCKSVLPPGRPCRFCGRDPEGLLRESFAPYRYRGVPRALALTLKFRGDTRAAALLAPAMARSLKAPDYDALVPVPLSAQRLWERDYNQARELAELVGHLAGIPARDFLIRPKKTARQTDQHSLRGRVQNVAGAFAAAPGADCVGKRILLVDDVRTTGATALSCARVLREAGAEAVDLLTACIAPGLVRGRARQNGKRFRIGKKG